MITICSSPARAALKGGATLSVQFMDTSLAGLSANSLDTRRAMRDTDTRSTSPRV